MADLATLQARLERIDEAIATGELEVEFSTGAGDSKRVRYRSVEELKAARQLILDLINSASGTVRARQVRMVTRDGYGGRSTQS